ncbi:MAG: 50S ribosomal protein L23, partial [Ruminobacter sp.]|nr:50S ribosomal protein L23 [Ruminobacter sp.]
MSNARDIIIRPLVTEKTLSNQDTNNTVVFEVA